MRDAPRSRGLLEMPSWEGCEGCANQQAGLQEQRPHSETCRKRMEEAMEQDFARDHALAIRSIASALDRQSIGALFDLIDAGDLSSVTDLVGASRAVN